MSNGERDNAGVVVPPPLIYLGPLILGLLLNRKFPVPFLPYRVACILGWPLVGGGCSLVFTWVGVKLVSTAVSLEVLAEGWGRSSRPLLAGILTETRLLSNYCQRVLA